MNIWALCFGLVGTVVSVFTLLILAMRGVLTVENRMTKLETRMEPFSEGLKALTVDALRGIKPGGNPIDPRRYQYLLNQMNTNSLSQSEASELNTALLELQQEARNGDDLGKLLIIGLGLLILASILKK
jgi:hypothetical protein